MLHDNSYHDGIEYLSGETYCDYNPYALSLISSIFLYTNTSNEKSSIQCNADLATQVDIHVTTDNFFTVYYFYQSTYTQNIHTIFTATGVKCHFESRW